MVVLFFLGNDDAAFPETSIGVASEILHRASIAARSGR
ncbi:hypothetical protein NY08_4145 [Rhodococcus sp. B7740]|nr:hypothetical protein NY08_4145 [Rhodococcus sp. B7740]